MVGDAKLLLEARSKESARLRGKACINYEIGEVEAIAQVQYEPCITDGRKTNLVERIVILNDKEVNVVEA